MSNRTVNLTTFIRQPRLTLENLATLEPGQHLSVSVHTRPIGVLCLPRPRHSIVEADCIGVKDIQKNCARLTQSMWANGLLHIMRDGKRVADLYGALHPDLVLDLQGEP